MLVRGHFTILEHGMQNLLIWILAGLLLSLPACDRSGGASAQASEPAQVAQQSPAQQAPPAPAKAKPCSAHSECPSGVCSHFKADNGECAPEKCTVGERADNNHFYCGKAGKWEKSKGEGEACAETLECYQPTCFMNPMCDANPKEQAACEAGKCVLRPLPDACTAKGWKTVLHPSEYSVDEGGRCMESLAQRVLQTVCVPCGNGKCDPDESKCNCPVDCK
jgi:hypothetical protein